MFFSRSFTSWLWLIFAAICFIFAPDQTASADPITITAAIVGGVLAGAGSIVGGVAAAQSQRMRRETAKRDATRADIAKRVIREQGMDNVQAIGRRADRDQSSAVSAIASMNGGASASFILQDMTDEYEVAADRSILSTATAWAQQENIRRDSILRAKQLRRQETATVAMIAPKAIVDTAMGALTGATMGAGGAGNLGAMLKGLGTGTSASAGTGSAASLGPTASMSGMLPV